MELPEMPRRMKSASEWNEEMLGLRAVDCSWSLQKMSRLLREDWWEKKNPQKWWRHRRGNFNLGEENNEEMKKFQGH